MKHRNKAGRIKKHAAHQFPFLVSKGLLLLLHRHAEVVQLELKSLDCSQLFGCISLGLLMMMVTLEPQEKEKVRQIRSS